jgi:histidyl-tRNA synthetase
MELLSHLRQNGISCELYPEPHKLKKQFAYADTRNIPAVLVLGEDEIREGKISMKLLASGEQFRLSLDALTDRLMVI